MLRQINIIKAFEISISMKILYRLIPTLLKYSWLYMDMLTFYHIIKTLRLMVQNSGEEDSYFIKLFVIKKSKSIIFFNEHTNFLELI